MSVAQDGEDSVEVADMRINQVVKMIRGPKGTVVTLTVKKPDDQVEAISITRDVVAIEAAYARGAIIDLGPKHQAMGIIYLPSFYGNTRSRRGMTPQRTATQDVRALLEEFSKRKVNGVIIDLRGNGCGLLDQARDIAGMFIETGPVVTTRYSNGESEVFTDKDSSVSFEGEVLVLVDRFSASASEIVAGALQDYGRGLIAGTATHGKGTVQVLLDLDRMVENKGKPLGVLKLTIQQFFRINGESTQWRGVVPDVELPDPAAHIESREKHLDNAIPWSKIEPLKYLNSDPQWSAAALAPNSKQRVSNQSVFAKLAKQSEYIKTRRDMTKVSLNRDKWLAQRAKDKKTLEELDAKLSEGKPRFAVKVVTPGSKAKPTVKNDRIEEWRKTLSRDPWVEEALYLLSDMVKARPAAR
jgi:carboxyl-terminal processing protease